MEELIKELEAEITKYRYNMDPNDDYTNGIVEGLESALDIVEKFKNKKIVEWGM